jgi:photosystem II stability/assembly factor-like uncharacterized protein
MHGLDIYQRFRQLSWLFGHLYIQKPNSAKMKKIFLFLTFSVWACSTLGQPATFYPRGAGGGGALFFPTINPANDSEFYISCDMSEMFHTTDFGKSYSQVPFTKLQVFGTSTWEFTTDPAIAYSIHNDGNQGYPVKTTDGGNTWTMLPGYDPNLGRVYQLRANYDKPGQVIMGYYGDLVISNNGGTTFSLIKHASNMGAGITFGGVVFDGNSIYIGTNEGIWYSTNSGNSFSLLTSGSLPSGEVIWNFCGARTGNTLRFYCITSSPGNTYNGVMPWDYYNFAKGVYSMDNASGTWVPRSTGLDFTNDFIMYAAMARNDINTVYLAGNDHSLAAPLVYKTTNAGATWQKVFITANNQNIETGWCGFGGDKGWSWAEICFGIAVAPYNSQKAVFGDYALVHTTSNGGTTWQQAYVNGAGQHPAGQPTPVKQSYQSIGLENTTCWQVFWISPANLFAAFSDNGGIRSTDSGQTWGYNYSGFLVNSLYRIVRTANGTLFASTSRVHDLYESTRLKDAQLDVSDASGNIYFSTDNGFTWNLLHAFGHPVYWIATDPARPDRMYASVVHYGGGGASSQGGIWMTDNLSSLSSSTWAHLSAPPRTEGHPACIEVLNDGKMACTFSGRMNASSVFTASSGIFLYDPVTGSWTDVSDPNMFYWTRDIIIDPADPEQNTWYAGVFSGWGGAPNGKGGLYKTSNRGTSWVKLTGSQFDRVTSLTFNPENHSHAYLTTETQGLWVSRNMNEAVPAWSLVDSYPFRQPERVFFNPFNTNEMWVTSFGNSLKVGPMNATSAVDHLPPDAGPAVFPNPFSGDFQINPGKPGDTYEIYNCLGATITSGTLAGKRTRILTASWDNGIYLLRTGGTIVKIIKR